MLASAKTCCLHGGAIEITHIMHQVGIWLQLAYRKEVYNAWVSGPHNLQCLSM